MTDTNQPARPFHRVRAVFVRLFGEPCRKQYVLWTLAVALWISFFLGLWSVVPNIPKLVIAHTGHEIPTFSPDGKFLALTEGADPEHADTFRVWDLEACRPHMDISQRNGRQGNGPITFSPDGTLLLAREESGDIAVWETATRKTVEHIDQTATSLEPIEDWGFSPDGRFIFLIFHQLDDLPPIERRACLRLWDVKTKKVRKTFCNDLLPPAFSSDGKHFACCHINERAQIITVEIWSLDDDVTASGPVKVHVKAHDVQTDKIVFSPTFDTFATVRCPTGLPVSETIEFWDMVTGMKKSELKEGDAHSISDVKFSAHGRFATCNTWPGNVLWDMSSGLKKVGLFPDQPEFSGDECWCLSISCARELEVYDTTTFQKHGTLWRAGDTLPPVVRFGLGPTKYKDELRAQFAPDSKTVLVTGLTAANSGNPVTDFLGQYIAWFKPVGGRKVARLWDVATATELAAFDDCTEAYYAPDGKTLVTVDEGGTIKVWDVPPHPPLLQITVAACVLWLAVVVGLQSWGRLPIRTSALMNRSASIS